MQRFSLHRISRGIAARSFLLGVIGLTSAVGLATAAPVARNLTVTHFEFNENGFSNSDLLVWDGPADHWDVYREIDAGSTEFLVRVANGSTQFRPSFYNFFTAPPLATSYYWVVGYDRQGLQQTTDTVSVRELLADPSFKGGPTFINVAGDGRLSGNLNWTQVSTQDGNATDSTNFIQIHSRGNTATLGGGLSLDQSIYTSQPTLVSSEVGTSAATVRLSYSVRVQSEEAADDPTAWDTMVVEIWDMDHLDQPLFQQVVADNTSQNSGRVNATLLVDYSLIRGKYISLVFHAVNDWLFPTTFELSNVDLNVSYTYPPPIVN